jgi:hypothetical protein
MRGESARNKIAKRFEETNKVKWWIYFVRWRLFQGPQILLINTDKRICRE